MRPIFDGVKTTAQQSMNLAFVIVAMFEDFTRRYGYDQKRDFELKIYPHHYGHTSTVFFKYATSFCDFLLLFRLP